MAVLIRAVIAAFALLDNDDFIAAGQHTVALIGQSGAHGNNCALMPFQPLGKLMNVVKVAVIIRNDLKMAIIHIAGGIDTGASARGGDLYMPFSACFMWLSSQSRR